MYTIHCDGSLLYSPALADSGYVALSPKLTMELNKAGSLTFTLPPTNPMYDGISKLLSVITVEQDGKIIWRGRELNYQKDFYNRKAEYFEGELAMLNDSIIRPYSFAAVEAGTMLNRYFLAAHNEQVDEDKQFIYGKTTVETNLSGLYRTNAEYLTTYDAIKQKLLAIHGGYIQIRWENGVRYLDYLADTETYSSQVIRFGTNLLDISEYINAENVFTVLIPLGARLIDIDEDSAADEDERLTIEDVNNGLDYIESEEGIALFGRIWKAKEWDGIVTASSLLAQGKSYLADGIAEAVSLTIKAIDLHLIDVDTEQINLGDHVRVVSEPHGIDKYYICSKIVIDMQNPENSEYTFGSTSSTLTESVL